MTSNRILKAHDAQLWLSKIIAKVGYNSRIGTVLRLGAYYIDGLIMFTAWTEYLLLRRDRIGDVFLGVDQALFYNSHEDVKRLMAVDPQQRQNDLGIIRILASSFMLNQHLTLGWNGREHAGARAIFGLAVPKPKQIPDRLANSVDLALTEAAGKGQLHIGKDLPGMVANILHQLIFQIELSPQEIEIAAGYAGSVFLTSLPEILHQTILKGVVKKSIEYRKKLIQSYQQSPQWQSFMEVGAEYGLNRDQVAAAIFDMIHVAGTAGTSALLGSVIGMLCLDSNLKADVTAEIDTLWDGEGTPDANALENSQLIEKVIIETARLYPPVRFSSQIATEAGEVEIGGKRCPFQKGTRMLHSIFTANRDPKKYENPDEFDINRDNSDMLGWNGYNHSRVCPGRSLSIGIIKMFCFYLLKKYQWDSASEVKWNMQTITAVTPNDLVLSGFRPLIF